MMSIIQDSDRLEPMSVLDSLDDAIEYVGELCSGKRRWVMSVPVREDDPDVTLSRALHLARRYIHQTLVDEVEREILSSDSKDG